VKKSILLFLIVIASNKLSAQFVATMEVKEPIEGACNTENIYALFPMLDGQQAPVCPMTNEEILRKLNAEVAFLKNHPKFKASLTVQTIISCEDQLVKCSLDTKPDHEELSQQLIRVFSNLGEWKAGRLNGEKVDCVDLWSIEIKKGAVVSVN
jgi:hypothetical protein